MNQVFDGVQLNRPVLCMGRKPWASSRTWSDSALTNPGPRFQRKTNREEVATTVRIVLTYFIRTGVKVHRGSYFGRRLFNQTFLPSAPRALPSSGTELGVPSGSFPSGIPWRRSNILRSN